MLVGMANSRGSNFHVRVAVLDDHIMVSDFKLLSYFLLNCHCQHLSLFDRPGHEGSNLKEWGPAATYLDLLSPKESHSALPLVEFICQIAEVDRSMFEATSTRYLNKIIDLVAIQIAYRKADPLVPLLRWPPVELQKLVSNLIGLLYQLWYEPPFVYILPIS